MLDKTENPCYNISSASPVNTLPYDGEVNDPLLGRVSCSQSLRHEEFIYRMFMRSKSQGAKQSIKEYTILMSAYGSVL